MDCGENQRDLGTARVREKNRKGMKRNDKKRKEKKKGKASEDGRLRGGRWRLEVVKASRKSKSKSKSKSRVYQDLEGL